MCRAYVDVALTQVRTWFPLDVLSNVIGTEGLFVGNISCAFYGVFPSGQQNVFPSYGACNIFCYGILIRLVCFYLHN